MSITGTGADDGACGNANSDSWHKAICASVAAGVTWVVSAGNAATGFEKTIPAAYPEVLTVTAMSDADGLPGAKGKAPACKKGEADDRYAAFSNYAATAAAAAHAIAAPGTCVVVGQARRRDLDLLRHEPGGAARRRRGRGRASAPPTRPGRAPGSPPRA